MTALPAESVSVIQDEIAGYLEKRVKAPILPEQDLFAAGLVSSLFAMELILHLEESYSVTIAGPDLRLENFRTVRQMTELVSRLGGLAGTGG
ncbi:acyl carrier protein [Amycolatopsis halotolerans]|uniref:Acyl carrier protein n=1 Tax=Amycolatopsis halotolerans TaxID=330083 RepID=A0ABV7QBE1_9PSEU